MKLYNFHYTPPEPEQLEAWKTYLGLSGTQMALLIGVAGANQWRKYTGGAAPRLLNLQTAFFAAAQLALSEAELNKVLAKMQEFGARTAPVLMQEIS